MTDFLGDDSLYH